MLAVIPELFLLLLVLFGSCDCIRISYGLFPIRSCDNQSLLLLVWLRRGVDPFADLYIKDASVYAGKVLLLTPWMMRDQRIVLKFIFVFVCLFFVQSNDDFTSCSLHLSVSHTFISSQHKHTAACKQMDRQML